MTTLYVFLQWARPAWILLILASAASIGMLITTLSLIHGWLADQFFMLDENEPDMQTGRTVFEIPVHVHTGNTF